MSKHEVKEVIKEHDEIETELEAIDRFWRWLNAQKPEYVEVMCDGAVVSVPVHFVEYFLQTQGDMLKNRKKNLDYLFQYMAELILKSSQ